MKKGIFSRVRLVVNKRTVQEFRVGLMFIIGLWLGIGHTLLFSAYSEELIYWPCVLYFLFLTILEMFLLQEYLLWRWLIKARWCCITGSPGMFSTLFCHHCVLSEKIMNLLCLERCHFCIRFNSSSAIRGWMFLCQLPWRSHVSAPYCYVNVMYHELFLLPMELFCLPHNWCILCWALWYRSWIQKRVEKELHLFNCFSFSLSIIFQISCSYFSSISKP